MFDEDFTLPFDIERALEEICLILSLDEDQEFALARNAYRYILNPNCVKEKLSYYKNMSICAATIRSGINKGQKCQRTAEPSRRTCKLHHSQEKDLPLTLDMFKKEEVEPKDEVENDVETEVEEKVIKPVGKNDMIIRPNGFGNMLFPGTNYILFEKKIVAKEGRMGAWLELSDADLEHIKRMKESGKKMPKVCKMDLSFRGDVKPPKN